MKPQCPKCGSIELRLHGQRVEIDYAKRHGWFGDVIPKVIVRGLDCSCANCMYAFVSRETGITEAPLQTAHDQLQRLKDGIAGAAPNKNSDEKPPARPVAPRPAADPRARRRER